MPQNCGKEDDSSLFLLAALGVHFDSISNAKRGTQFCLELNAD